MLECGARIRAYRVAQGVSAKELAMAVGLSHASLSRLEHGKQNISLHVLCLLSVALDVPLWSLLGKEEHAV